jgi:hypothetical protein
MALIATNPHIRRTSSSRRAAHRSTYCAFGGSSIVKNMLIDRYRMKELAERRAPFDVAGEPVLVNDEILDRYCSWRPGLLF